MNHDTGMRKQAAPGDGWKLFFSTAETASDASKLLLSTAFATAGLAGVMTGYGLSRASSPGEQEEKNYQREYLLTTMRSKIARYRRDKELANSTIVPQEQRRTALDPVPPKKRDVVLG